MKQLKINLIFLLVLFFNYCVTANINQPPVVVEKSTPYSYFKSSNSHPYLQDDTKEEEFFEELSKQDPFLKEDCKNCKHDNQAPGYIEETKPQKQEEVVVVNHADSSIEEGVASWYGKDFDGRPTASGEIFDSRKLTGAHRTLPLGTIVSVKNLDNNKEVILKINDRGPYIKNRIIDVSEYAAELLDFKYKGLTRVRIEVIKFGDLKEKNEGATAIFFKSAEKETGSSPYEILIEDKKNQLLNNIKPIEEFKYYSVQIGSFSDIKNIIRLKEELEKKIPYPIFILKNNNEYVIRIGSFSDRYPAEVLKLKLEEYGYKGYVASPI